jgi:uncharacterized lipoprotein
MPASKPRCAPPACCTEFLGDDVKVFQVRLGVLAAAALLLSACSMLEGGKIDYKSAGKGQPLEVPPDLTQLSRDSRYQVPGGPVTASSYEVGQAAPALPTAATTLGDVRIERAGQERWLVVNRPADKLWEPVREFWQENGFLLTIDQPALGIMETDWAENRAKIPQDFIRNILGKVIDSVYSTSERDKFRTRMERSASGGTEIYISHRGMEEVYNSANKDNTVWQPRPADPEMEAEFLRRLMVKLGTPADQAKALVAAAPSRARPPWRWTTASTAHGDAWASRSIAPASRWKTATAARARISCAMSSRTPIAKTAACSPRSSARTKHRTRSSTASRSSRRARRPRCPCSTQRAHPRSRPSRRRSWAFSLTT